jgi:hypothetical protein
MSITFFLCDNFNFEIKILHSCVACLVLKNLVLKNKITRPFCHKGAQHVCNHVGPITKACSVCKEFVGEGSMFHYF